MLIAKQRFSIVSTFRRIYSYKLKPAAKKYFPSGYFFVKRKFADKRWQKTNEYLASKGKLKSPSSKKSIVLFTTWKCASVFTENILKQVTTEEKLIHIDYVNTIYEFNLNANLLSQSGFLTKGFNPTGFYYGSFRSPVAIPQMDSYRVLLQLRDPRDILTSLYFSMKYSHPLSNYETVKNRRHFSDLSVDEICREYAPKYRDDIFMPYHDMITRYNWKYFSYEQMVTDFESWLKEVVEYLEIDVHPEIYDSIIAEADFSVKKEDVNKHKRSVKPGNFREKLEPETVDYLNDVFKDVLPLYGYSI